jgi:O-antigen/teichoic acid export membrane protein
VTAGGPGRGRTLFAWGLVDQGLSSVTTFSLSLLTARELGPVGLGTLTLGYAAFLSVLGVQRALITDPLITRLESAKRTPQEALRSALAVTLCGSFLLLALGLGLRSLSSGSLAQGVAIFAPWFAPALAQALMRQWLYREGKGRIAALSMGSWLATMLVAIAAGLHHSDWQFAAAWGLGACVAFALAAAKVHGVGLAAPRAAGAWFTNEALGIGIWRTFSGVVFSFALYLRVALMSAILGSAAVGGYRAIETAFAPTTLIGPALANPGVPVLRRVVDKEPASLWPLALRISGVGTALVLAYILPVAAGRGLVMDAFGPEFRHYQSLILPVAVGAIVGSLGTGFSVLLLAARRMTATAVIVLVQSVLTVGVTAPLALTGGLDGAAWGIAIAAIPPFLLIAVVARRIVRELTGAASHATVVTDVSPTPVSG